MLALPFPFERKRHLVPVDADLSSEQDYLDRAYALLGAMASRAEALYGELCSNGKPDPDLLMALSRRVALLQSSKRPLCFGRIDEQSGASWYIGRRHVEDESASPVVVEWRAPIAEAFYRARPSEPLGLWRRRQFVLDGTEIVQMADDLFTKGSSGVDPRLRGGDALLAELERARSGEMQDIVATIQAEQDDVIRAPAEGVLLVQGGPGTGKTAIALHRAAYLLYHLPELASKGVLVLGPNRVFLRYIAAVLPSLGEESVVQTTLFDLVHPLKVAASPSELEDKVKGDARMATVLARALCHKRRRVEAPVVFEIGLRRVVVEPEELNGALDVVASRPIPYNAGRAALRDRLVGVVHANLVRSAGGLAPSTAAELGRALRREDRFKATLDHLWPAVSPAGLVHELLSSRERLERAGAGVLAREELEAVVSHSRSPLRKATWTTSDVALIDEARELLEGRLRSYGHIVVDEVQDLSAMQLRMVARRCPSGSMTLFGDLAQASTPSAVSSWEEVCQHLGEPVEVRRASLTLGYRAPGEVLELASRLLSVAAPGLPPTESVRRTGEQPVVIEAGEGRLFAAVAGEAARLRALSRSLGVIMTSEHALGVKEALTSAGIEFGEIDLHGLERAVTLCPPERAKGLEFDACLVVEPSAIAGDAARGLRLLYVALTRPIRSLSIVHNLPLPDALMRPADAPQELAH